MSPTANVIDNADLQRFEWTVDGATAVVHYRREGRVLWLDHAGVPPVLEGRGIGTELVAAVLALVRARGETVVPVCSFIARYFERHPQERDLLASR